MKILWGLNIEVPFDKLYKITVERNYKEENK